MPKIVDHDARRLAIVEATCDVIATDGLDGATMRRIAAAAGSTTGLVTHYFANKDELLLAALRHVHATAGRRMIEQVRTAPDPLLAIVGESLPLDAARAREWRVWLAFWGRAVTAPRLAEEQRVRYAEWRAFLGDALAGARPDVNVDALMGVIDGIGVRATLDPDRFDAEHQLRVVEAFLAGR